MTAQTYLAAYEAWVRAASPGLAPSATQHGVQCCDHTLDLCAIDERVRKESGLGSWEYYNPELVADRRDKGAAP